MELNGVADLPEIRPATTSPTSSRIGPLSSPATYSPSPAPSSRRPRAGRRISRTTRSVAAAEEIADRIAKLADEEKDPRFAQAVLEESTELLIDAPSFADRDPVRPHLRQCGDRPLERAGSRPVTPAEATDRERRADSSGARTAGPRDVAVIVTDTCGRPFRHGQRGVALGWARMPASRDWRGELDRDGHELGVTVQSVVDELAAAANLVTGEGAGTPAAVVVRGWDFGKSRGERRTLSIRRERLRSAVASRVEVQ